ncbi:hypothetical protein [Jannaschia sp. CCS1]|uniref:hypothetical protein n=1 Tax=Jannaschia sp. (strain CCS1) TaxID=290400 RepID=UPI000053B011|nr:hypothetical protein [Jannaschia sp. CCS1]ABD53015.1 hypothetical protein Jann_0098 [Jannaschia sp. CCS1]
MMATVSARPLLLTAQAGFLGLMLIRAFNRDTMVAAATIATSLGARAVATPLMGRSGFYQSDRFLMLMSRLWLPVVPFVMVGITLIFAPVRSGLSQPLTSRT